MLQALSATTGNAEVVTDIAEAGVVHYLFAAIMTLPTGLLIAAYFNERSTHAIFTPGRLTALEILHQLVSNPKIVIESLKKGDDDHGISFFAMIKYFRRSRVPARPLLQLHQPAGPHCRISAARQDSGG